MQWTYSCPHCHAVLNSNETIMLRAERKNRRFLIGLHPQPGNYEVELPPGEEMRAGSKWSFSCPVCDHSLVSELSEDLCALDMTSPGAEHRIFFSRVTGERATFTVSAEGMLTDHGIHTDQYLEQLVQRKYMR